MTRTSSGAAALLALALLAGCTDDGASPPTTTTGPIEMAPPGPVVASATYREVDLTNDPTHGAINKQVAVTAGSVLFYGGQTVVPGDPMEFLARGDGALLDLGTGHLSDIPAWPYADSPFSPGIVALDDVFLVVGTPCAARISDEGHAACGGAPQAATFDPETSTWQRVPAPSDQLDLDSSDDFSTDIAALGARNGMAYFIYSDARGSLASIVGYDASSSSWHDLSPLASLYAAHCVTSSGLLRSSYEPEDNQPTAELLDLDAREWRSTADGSLSDLPDPSAGDVISGSGLDAPFPPRPKCAGDQLIATDTQSGVPPAMYWYRDKDTRWYELPMPALLHGDYPGGALLDEVLVLWPNATSGEPQVRSADRWMAIDGAPPLSGPELFVDGDQIVVVGLEPTTDTVPRTLRVGTVRIQTP